MGTKWWTVREEIDFYKACHLQGKTIEETEHAWHIHPIFGKRRMPRFVVEDTSTAIRNLTAWY